MLSITKSIYLFSALFCWVLIMISSSFGSEGEVPAPKNEETMLMFVGEDLDVLSIASKRQESAWQAPAVAQVVTRGEIEERGIKTLSQALEMLPGFYMAQKEWGTQAYLRGIPDSVLFLYNTVPVGSDTTKSWYPMGHELSMAPIKRIEIIRGPGSVLWGADAFAGIVNMVPMTGKDLDGLDSGILYGGPGDQEAFYVNMGHDAGSWDVFLSMNGRKGEEDDTRCNLVQFWGDGETPIMPQDRFGQDRPGRSRYFEVSGNLSFSDCFMLTGLFSKYKRPYAISETEGDLTWRESRSVPFGLIKLEGKKKFNRSSVLRFMGSCNWMNPEYVIIDRTLEQRERTLFGEITYDHSFLAGSGLLTSGFSFRKKYIKDAPIYEGYLPEYLVSNNPYFVPMITEKGYHKNLWSLFGQYTHKIGDVDLWFGLRNDEHDEYRDNVSYNTGVAWSPRSTWMFKVLYGTAYRTPFAGQLLKENNPELEEIKTLNIQVACKPSKYAEISLCGFISRIENHIMIDPYAGLSLPNHQDIKGVEIEGRFSPSKNLDFTANITLIDNNGPDETYHYNDYSFIRPDGTVEQHFTDLEYSYDSGPSTLFNLTGTWRSHEKVSSFLRLGYFSSRRLIYPRGETFHSCPGVWLLDMNTTIRDIVFPGLELEFSLRNLADNHYKTPGTYSSIDGKPFSMEVVLRKRW